MERGEWPASWVGVDVALARVGLAAVRSGSLSQLRSSRPRPAGRNPAPPPPLALHLGPSDTAQPLAGAYAKTHLKHIQCQPWSVRQRTLGREARVGPFPREAATP